MASGANNGGDQSKLPQLWKDIFMIIANGIHHCNKKRKSLIRTAFSSKYQRVCDVGTPVTSNLFGDELEDKVEEIEKQERRSQKIAGKTSHFFYTKSLPKRPGQHIGRADNGTSQRTYLFIHQ